MPPLQNDRGTRPDVVLVAAPFLVVTRPALGISTLQAALAARGIAAQSRYFNIEFAERLGLDLYHFICEWAPNNLLIGDWIFAPEMSLPDMPADAAYLARAKLGCADNWPGVLRARQLVNDFVAQAAAKLADSGARIVGFSTTFQQNCASLAIARRLKQLAPEIAICFGGSNCDGPMGSALFENFPQIDYVFRGEADVSFPAFAERFLSGETPFSTDPDVLGRSGVAPGPPTPPIRDLDALPIPEFADFFATLGQTSFNHRIVPGILFESARGCWWGAKHHCTFCGLNGSTMEFRTKSPQRVLAEIDALFERWRVPYFDAADNIMNIKHIDGVFGELADREACEYRFFYEIKSNMRPAQMRTVARGGVIWVQPGIESLDDRVLQLMEKGVSGLQNIRLLRTCWELGMRTTWNILFGFPGEPHDAYRKHADWVPLLEHFDAPTALCRVRFDRFSPLYERAAALGVSDLEPTAAYESVYNLPRQALMGLAYHFDGKAAGAATEDVVRPLREAIARWQAAQRDARGLPMLVLVEAGSINIVKDTRSIALNEIHILRDDDVAVLRAFDDPAEIAVATARLAEAGIAADTVSSAIDRFIDCGFLLVDNNKAVNLVCDPTQRIIGEAKRNEYPGGWIREAAAS